ncbi:MAG: DMT family transporter [Oscillospiraceae bacterium]|nr:DMT family transporter [Oscillospiraceae bacterium]MCL2278544.1 DMT family transporter [Oscillospiraceae bacterium]
MPIPTNHDTIAGMSNVESITETKVNKNGPFFIAAAALCWSFGGVLIRFIPWSALSIVGLRALFATFLFLAWRRSFKINFTFGNIITAICVSATTFLFVFANQLTTAAAAILLQFTSPIFIILMFLVFYKKMPKRGEVIAVFVTIIGMTMFFVDELGGTGLLGNILAVISGLSFAGVYVGNKRHDTNPEHAIFLGFLINTAIGVPFAITDVTADLVAWGSVIFLGLVQVGLAYVFFSKGIKKTPALLACLISTIEPILNPTWVYLAGVLALLPETEIPGTFALIGGVIIVCTVIGFNFWQSKNPTDGIG